MPRQLVLDLHHAVDRRRRVLVSAPFVTNASRWWRLRQLSRDAFISLRCCTLRALSPVDLPHSQLRLAAEDEWLEIMGDELHMTREAFFASLLEIVDACLPPLSDEDACAAALDALFAAVTTTAPQRWRSAADVSFGDCRSRRFGAGGVAPSRRGRRSFSEPRRSRRKQRRPRRLRRPRPQRRRPSQWRRRPDASPRRAGTGAECRRHPAAAADWRAGRLRSSLSETARPAGRAQPVPLPAVIGAVGAARQASSEARRGGATALRRLLRRCGSDADERPRRPTRGQRATCARSARRRRRRCCARPPPALRQPEPPRARYAPLPSPTTRAANRRAAAVARRDEDRDARHAAAAAGLRRPRRRG